MRKWVRHDKNGSSDDSHSNISTRVRALDNHGDSDDKLQQSNNQGRRLSCQEGSSIRGRVEAAEASKSVRKSLCWLREGLLVSSTFQESWAHPSFVIQPWNGCNGCAATMMLSES